LIQRYLPGLNSLAGYNSSKLAGDINAGIMVAILFIPQCMAYATIAGVPPVIGLYAATLPLIIYSFFGTSRHLSVGPVSIVSLLAFSGVSAMAEPGTSSFLEIIVLLGLVVGIIQLLMGVIRIGPLFDYISHAVITGFTFAVALIIALNQIESIVGVNLSSFQNPLQFSLELISNSKDSNPYTIGIGLFSICCLIVIKRIIPLSIGPFIVIILSTLCVSYYKLDLKGINIVGEIPKGLPDLGIPSLSFHTLQEIAPIAVGIASISFLESYAVAKAIAQKENYQLNTNKELISLGLSNISTTFIGTIPVAGAFSRTAVNYNSGAKTNLSSLISALLIITSLLFFTPFFYFLPVASLSAIIIISVLSLINLNQLFFHAKTLSFESVVFFVTLVATLAIDIFAGLIIGILLSILFSLINKMLFQHSYKR
jgi:SulP family sulfate permease